MTHGPRQPKRSPLGVVARFLFWAALGAYFAIASVAGANYFGFLALICGWCAGRHTEPPR